MKQSIIINVMTLITFGIMKAAWELAAEGQKMHGGKKSEYLGESMRQAWAVKKAGGTQEAALKAGGYELTQRHKDGVRKLKQQTALAAQKETHNSQDDAALVAEYLATAPVQKAVATAAVPATARAHAEWAEYAATAGAPRKQTRNFEDYSQDVDYDHNQAGGDMDCASQDADDYCKCVCCGGSALKVSMVKGETYKGGYRAGDFCPVCIANQQEENRIAARSAEYKKHWKSQRTLSVSLATVKKEQRTRNTRFDPIDGKPLTK